MTKTLTLLALIVLSLTTSAQKTVYSAHWWGGGYRSCTQIKFGPDKKIREDDICDKKAVGWQLYTYKSPPLLYMIHTQMKKLVYDRMGGPDVVVAHQPVVELGDTVIMGYKCQKISVVVTQIKNVGFAKSKFDGKYTYYITKELAYPYSYNSANVAGFYVPAIDIDGVLLKGSYEVVGADKNKRAQEMARNFYLTDLTFDKIDEIEFADPK
ncbi:MAG: hypothetical protein JWO03_4130 [Bacteroidetes bacterium]|nr:hypothetical protein [Bacteroidota bacterium]